MSKAQDISREVFGLKLHIEAKYLVYYLLFDFNPHLNNMQMIEREVFLLFLLTSNLPAFLFFICSFKKGNLTL